MKGAMPAGQKLSIGRTSQATHRCCSQSAALHQHSRVLVKPPVFLFSQPPRQASRAQSKAVCGGSHLWCSKHSSFLGASSHSLLEAALPQRQPLRRALLIVRASKGPLSVPKPRVPIEVSNILTVLTTVFLVTSEPLFHSAGLTGSELHRTVISTQAIGLFLILGLTVQSYLDLRALREATSGTETERPSEPSEAQAEVVDNADLLKELGRSQPSKDELKIFVTSGEGKKTKTLRLEEWSLDGARDYESLIDTVRKIVPQLTAYPLTVLYQVRQTGEFFLLEAEDDVPKLLGTAGFVYIHPSPSWE
ncbi:hypothetical protein KFL_000100630 [Klebsormidium nitens]|uniref:Uncharacterized protein n=1 Tax=Klebsormidium nitens TaxID=105231 RepID=A0A1Y1HR48_KLENI|nr:hypothetical protein KFL_000100630 [Klebsormidium nitens]|eukprot:GAQ78298.1 hypothetical protein KFL_000100630 [Klebsormidium nitens]